MTQLTARTKLFLAIIFGVGLLQAVLLWHIQYDESFICNGLAAWPLHALPFLGSVIITLVFTLLVFFWAWKEVLCASGGEILCWALILSAGVSHTLEKLTGQCVLDYWRFSSMGKGLFFNLGDIFLTFGFLGIAMYWFFSRTKS